jgi:tetratricopeptide (TPR) repeat protein
MAKQNLKTVAPRTSTTTAVKEDEVLMDVGEVAKGTQSFFETNKKVLMYIGIGLLAVIGGKLAWDAYVASNQTKALQAMWRAERMFEQDSFALALSNPGGGYEGFTGIASKYGSTPSGNLANYYAGICYLQLGKFDEAIKHLDDFSPSGSITPTMKYGAMGDAYSEKKDFAKALKNYKEAASEGSIEDLKAIYLKRYGLLSEQQGNVADALSAYERIRTEFGASSEARDIEKFIARAEAKKK